MIAWINAAQKPQLTRIDEPPSIHWILDMNQRSKFEPHRSEEMHLQRWTWHFPEAKRNEDLFRRRQLTRSATASLTGMKLMKVICNTKHMMNKEFQYWKEL
jgi:hypothetical protein